MTNDRKLSLDNRGGLDSTFQLCSPLITWDSTASDGHPRVKVSPSGVTIAAYSPLGNQAICTQAWEIELTGTPTGSNVIVGPLDSSGAAAYRLLLTSGRVVQPRDAANATTGTVGTGPALAIGTRYRLEWTVTPTVLTLKVFLAETATQVGSTVTQTSTFGATDNFRYGQLNASPNLPPYYIYDLRFVGNSSAFLGPDLPPVAQTAPRIAIIGDSLTNMAANATTIFGEGQELLEAAFAARGYEGQNIYLWGVGGKRISVADLTGRTTMSNWADASAMLTNVDHVIIALGTNDRPQTDATVNASIDTLIAAIPSTIPTTWIGLTSKGFASVDDIRVNNLLKAKIAVRPNATFADWDAAIRAVDHGDLNSPLWQPGDSTHMTHDGYNLWRAPFYALQVPDLATPPADLELAFAGLPERWEFDSAAERWSFSERTS